MSRRRKRPSPGPQARSAAPPRPEARAPFAAALALALAGLVLSFLLARLHARAHAGIASFCAVNDVVNCDRVATSRFSVVLGLPVAVWGAFGYGLAGTLAAWGLAVRPPRGRWPAGLLFLVAGAAVAASAALAVVSEVAIGAWCLLCAGSWAVSAALLVAAWRACRPVGVTAAIRDDLAAAREKPGGLAILAVTSAAAIALTAAVYPRYWTQPRAGAPDIAGSAAGSRAPSPGLAGPGTGAPAAQAQDAGPAALVVNVPEGVVVEYSDYECPYCARAHEETRAILATRPDITLVRRHFPLDASCNPAVARTIHPTACALARAAICAEAQGRFSEMDDALFRNQRERLAPSALAERIGLDLNAFSTCVGSRETEHRLAADVALGIRDGVRATPTYLVDHTASAGRLPVELLPRQARQGGP